MAAQRPIEILINAAVGGLGEVAKLVNSLDQTSAEAIALQAQAKTLSDALGLIGKQQAAISSLRDLGMASLALSSGLNAAQKSAATIAGELALSAQSAAQFSQAQIRAATAVSETKAAIAAQTAELKLIRAGATDAAKGTTEYRTAVEQAVGRVAALRMELAAQKTTLTQAKDATKAATTEENALKAAYEAAVGAASRASRAYSENRQSMDTAREAARQLGIDTTKLGDAQRQVQANAQQAKQGLDAFTGAAQAAKVALEAQAQAQAQAAKTAKLQDDAARASAAAIQLTIAGIRQSLALEQSSIDLQQRMLAIESQRQQSLRAMAKARGDDVQATQASASLAQLELERGQLLARSKTAEATALKLTTEARREALAAVGPLTRAQVQELQAADNLTASLRAQAAALLLAANAAKTESDAARASAAAAKTQAEIRAQIAAADKAAHNEEMRLAGMVAATRARLAAQARAEAQGILADYARMESAQRAAAAAATAAAAAAANAMKAAFGTVGVRAAADIRAEIQRVRDAMQLLATNSGMTGRELANAMKVGQQAVAGLERELRRVSGTMTTADKAANLLKNSIGQITAGNIVADGVGYLVGKVKELGSEFVQAVMQGERMRLALTAIYKDSGVAATQIKFLKDSASAAGLAYGSLTRDFIKFSAATNSAAIPLKQANDLFSALTRASGALGMSTDEVSGALNALGQMASKGVVSMEELRQQLGDRLPGAIGLTAKAFGISEKMLIDLVSSGQLAFRDMIVPLTTALRGMAAETDSLSGAWGRLGGMMTGVAQDLGDAGWATILTGALKILGTALGAVVAVLQALYEGLQFALKGVLALDAAAANIFGGFIDQLKAGRLSIGELANSISTELGIAFGFLGEEARKTNERLDNTGRAIKSLWGVANEAPVVLGAMAQASVAAAQSMDGVGKAAELQALAIKLAGDAALDASAKIVQFNAAAEGMMKAQKADTDAAAKRAAAMRDEGAAMAGLIAMRGDEQKALVASAAAAENYLGALEAVADGHRAEVQILEAQMAALKADQVLRNLSEKDIKAQKDALEAKLATARAEEQQSISSAAAARQDALARDVSAKAYADNSARVEEYVEALADAENVLARVKIQHENNMATTAQLITAQEGASRAQAMYNDALTDSVTKLQAYATAKKSLVDLETASLNAALKEAEAAEKIAMILGRQTEARAAARTQREIEIKLSELKVRTLRDEAESMEAVARAEEKALIAKGELKEVDQLRIANSLRAADAKKAEATATEAGLAVMKKEASQLSATTELYVKRGEEIKKKNAEAQAESNLVKSGLELKKSELDASIAIAEANGDEVKVTKLKIEQKRIEIQIIQETVKAQIADAEASISVAEAKMSELRATGSLTEEKRVELETQIKNSRAKINEAKARGESVRVLEQEIKTLQGSSNAQDANTSSLNRSTAAIERQNKEKERTIAALEKENELKQRQIDLYNAYWKMDAEHNSVGPDGKRIEVAGQTQQSLYNAAKDTGLTAGQAKDLADKYAPQKNATGYSQFDNNGFWAAVNELKQQNELNAERAESDKKNADKRQALQDEQDKKYNDAIQKMGQAGGNVAPPSPAPVPVPRASPAPRPQNQGGGSASITPAPSYVQNITLPGVGSAKATFDSATEQQNMQRIIGALTSAAGASQ